MPGKGMRVSEDAAALEQRDWDRGKERPENPAFFRLVLETSPDIFYIFDRVEQRYPFVSGRCKEILGYTPQQIQRMPAKEVERLIHPEDLQRARDHYAKQERLSDHAVAEASYRVARSTGEYRLLRYRQKVFSRGRDGVVQRHKQQRCGS